jgi:hypothetical protein
MPELILTVWGVIGCLLGLLIAGCLFVIVWRFCDACGKPEKWERLE